MASCRSPMCLRLLPWESRRPSSSTASSTTQPLPRRSTDGARGDSQPAHPRVAPRRPRVASKAHRRRPARRHRAAQRHRPRAHLQRAAPPAHRRGSRPPLLREASRPRAHRRFDRPRDRRVDRLPKAQRVGPLPLRREQRGAAPGRVTARLEVERQPGVVPGRVVPDATFRVRQDHVDRRARRVRGVRQRSPRSTASRHRPRHRAGACRADHVAARPGERGRCSP